MVGYMLTWTTYGTWLQGDQRGYVKNGRVLSPCRALQRDNFSRLKCPPARLTEAHRTLAANAILAKAADLGQEVPALAVCSNHVHMVIVKDAVPIEKAVSYYKNAARIALRQAGHRTTLWSRGYDKRFCLTEHDLHQRITYVNNHNH